MNNLPTTPGLYLFKETPVSNPELHIIQKYGNDFFHRNVEERTLYSVEDTVASFPACEFVPALNPDQVKAAVAAAKDTPCT